jgi:hypothetical protein
MFRKLVKKPVPMQLSFMFQRQQPPQQLKKVSTLKFHSLFASLKASHNL